MNNRRLPTLLMLSVLALFLITLTTTAQDVSNKVDELFNKIEESKGEEFWSLVSEVNELGREAIPDVRSQLTRANSYVRLAAANFLYDYDNKEEAIDTLLKVIESKDERAKRLAAGIIISSVSKDESISNDKRKGIVTALKKEASAIDDKLTQIALWRCIWNINNQSREAVNAVKAILSADKKVKEEAVLTLAEIDNPNLVKEELKEIANKPTDNGRLARAYLQLEELQDRANKSLGSGKNKYNYKMLDEMIDLLKEKYYDPKKIKESELIEAAARGLAASLDPYTAYYDEPTIKQLFEEELEGEYGGIGARVSMRKDKSGIQWLTIEEPIFSGPAYKAGLRSLDKIVEIEGESTANKDVSELVKKLRGKAETSVKFKVVRRGWLKEKEYTLERKKVVLDTTLGKLLPGNIGYVKITTFGHRNIEEVKDTINNKLKGIKGLIFDLRGNSGGYLDTGEQLSEVFLEKGKLIVTTQSRGKEVRRRISNSEDYITCPMVVLVDGGSASASEIMAGALRDNGRAKLIGDKTFGKGLVQDIIRLKTSNERTALRLTISEWFPPSGKNVEGDKRGEGGIEPDISVPIPERDFWKDAETDKLRQDSKIEEHINDKFQENKKLFIGLAESDGLDYTRYPGFDELYRTLNTKLTKDDVRELLREYVRKQVADDKGEAFVLDYETDIQLQSAILELCKTLQVNPAELAEYKVFAKAIIKDDNMDR